MQSLLPHLVGARDVRCISFESDGYVPGGNVYFWDKMELLDFSKKKAYDRFRDLQKKIIECGYKTYDIS